MARPQFESVVAQAPRKHLEYYTQDITGDLEFDDVVLVFAPEGYISSVVGLVVGVKGGAGVPGATTGTQNIYVNYDLEDAEFGLGNIDLVTVIGSFDDDVTIKSNTASGGSVETLPGKDVSAALMNVYFDDVTPLMLVYSNRTDGIQTEERHFRLAMSAEQVAN